MKKKLKQMWNWLRRELLNKDMLVWFIIGELIFWSPCVVGVVLAVLFDSWFWTIPTVYIAFWAGPFTPAIPLQIGLAYGLKKLAAKIKKIRKKKNKEINDEKE